MRQPLSLAALIACALTACASVPNVPARDGDAMSPSPLEKSPFEHGHQLFAGARGTQLYAQWWRPRSGTPRGVLVVVHGLKDHGSRYAELAERAVAAGFAVYAMDLRGHAHSEGPRVEIESFDDYLDDLDALLSQVRAREPGRPLFLLGHSMGGAIATLYTITRKPALAGLITSGAALQIDASGIRVASVKLVAAIAPHAGLFQLDLDDFSRDPEVVRACKADPLVYQPGAPIHTARALIAAVDRIEQGMPEISVPLLILHGSADRITPPAGSQALHDRAASKDKTLKLYPGLYHDLLHEPEKAQVMADIVAWLEAHAPARSEER